ncbi:MAG: hypothetical protein QW594_04005, partial [Candidatus Woesearchaeota archaeon]
GTHKKTIDEYYQKNPWIDSTLYQYHAKNIFVPKELIYTTLLYENLHRTLLDDLGEYGKLLLGDNPSLGMMQVRISTAKELTGLNKTNAIALLTNKKSNLALSIDYYVREMEALGYSGYEQGNESITASPQKTAELIARYLGGSSYNFTIVKKKVIERLQPYAQNTFPFTPSNYNPQAYRDYIKKISDAPNNKHLRFKDL